MAVLLGTLLFALVGHAGPTEMGVLRAPVGDEAQVQRFVTVEPRHASFMVHDCNRDLARQLEGRNTDGILEIEVIGVGDGSWYVEVLLADEDADLSVGVEDGRMVLTTRDRRSRAAALELDKIGIDQLLAEEELPEAAPPPDMPMPFLHGQALLPAVEPSTYPPLLPVYAPGVGPGSWADIDAAREIYLDSDSEREQAAAIYALGWNYLKLGFAREARYYFDLLEAYDHAFDPRVIAMTRARVAIMLADWDLAREQLERGHQAGASPEQVLESLALVSLATHDPPPCATAQALLGASGRPEAWLLAAELLQRDNHYAASIEVLQGLESRVMDSYRPWVALRLGDALLATHDTAGAERAYMRAPETVAELRTLHAQLLRAKSSHWPRIIPRLRQIAISRDETAPEALYLLAQVNHLFGENASAMADLKELEERYAPIFERSDGDLRLRDLYEDSLRSLHEQMRWVEMAALHRQNWSRKLLDCTDDHEPLVMVADAFERMGLPDEARHALGDAFYVMSKREGDDPVLVFRLARLYAHAGRHQEALETLAYLGKHDLPPEYRGQRALLSARIMDDNGDEAGALSAYMSAARFPETRDEAQISMALRDAEAGRCDQAIPSLTRLLLPERKRSRMRDPLPFLALARCLMAEGRMGEAAEVAREAAGRIEAPEDARHATYLSTSANQEGDVVTQLSRDALLTEHDVWSLLGKEDLEAARFEAEIAERRARE